MSQFLWVVEEYLLSGQGVLAVLNWVVTVNHKKNEYKKKSWEKNLKRSLGWCDTGFLYSYAQLFSLPNPSQMYLFPFHSQFLTSSRWAQ